MDEKWKDYFYKGAAVFLTVAMCILFFFVVFRFDDLRKYIGIVIKILMPFIYGGVLSTLVNSPRENHITSTFAIRIFPFLLSNLGKS